MTSDIERLKLDFSALMETIAKGEGLSPTAGRVLGYLLMSEAPVTFADLSRSLAVSRGGLSENTTLLEKLGIIQRSRFDGDRRDHFSIREDARDALQERARERAQSNLALVEAFGARPHLSTTQRERVADMVVHLRTCLVPVPSRHSTARKASKP